MQRHVYSSLNDLSEPALQLQICCIFYTAAVRPVLEYACTVWHSSLTAAQCDVLEMVQKRVIRIIYSDGDYDTSLIVGDIGTDRLSDRREVLIFKFDVTSRSLSDNYPNTLQVINNKQYTPTGRIFGHIPTLNTSLCVIPAKDVRFRVRKMKFEI